jgi:O-antigen/teichoic acid export membrane protein
LNLYRNLSSVAAVGVIDIGFSLASNILFPRTVPKAEFAAYRIFLLYSGYAGIVHFGLLDGLYLRAVGHEASDVPAELVSRVRRGLWVLLCLASFAILPLLLRFGVPDASIGLPLVLVGMVVATNLVAFYTYLLQATSHFGLVARMVAAPRVVGVVAAMALIILGVATAMRLALCVLGPVVASAALLAGSSRSMPWRSDARGSQLGRVALLPVWRDGMALFLGNVGITVALTAGTLVASLVLERQTFAEYAFAAGLVSLMFIGFEWLAVAASPLHAKLVRTGSASTEWERLLLALMWLSPTVYWGGLLVVRVYLPSYEPSLGLLAWLAGSLPFFGIVRTRAATVCRATGRQDAFLRLGVTGCVVVGAAVAAGGIYGHGAAWIAASWALAIAVLGSVGWLVVTRAYRLPAFRVDVLLVASAVAAGGTFAVAHSLPSPAAGAAVYLALAMLGLMLGLHGLSLQRA